MMCTLVLDGHTCAGHTIRNPSGDPTSGHISIQSHLLPIVTHTVCLFPTQYAMISQSSCSCERDPIYLLCGSLCPLSMPLDIIFGVRNSKRDVFSSLVETIIGGHDNPFIVKLLYLNMGIRNT